MNLQMTWGILLNALGVPGCFGRRLKPLQPPVGSRAGHLAEPRQSCVAIARADVQVDREYSFLVHHDHLPNRGVIWLGEVGEPVFQLAFENLHLQLHAVPVAAVEFDEGPEGLAAGVLGEVQDQRQELGLPVDHLQPIRCVHERQGVFEEIPTRFRLTQQFDEPVSVGGEELFT